MENQLTQHAKTRFRQRGINEIVVDYLKKYGKATYAPGGALRFSLTRRNADKIIGDLKREIHKIEHARGVIIVQKDGQILTGYHRS